MVCAAQYICCAIWKLPLSFSPVATAKLKLTQGCCCSRPATIPSQLPPPPPPQAASNEIPKEEPKLQEHPNRPLKPAKPWHSEKRLWTREELDKAREEFFHISQAVNDPAAWIIIQEVCKLLWDEAAQGKDVKREDIKSLGPSPALLQARVRILRKTYTECDILSCGTIALHVRIIPNSPVAVLLQRSTKDHTNSQLQGILEAAELTTPKGSMSTIYDAQGRKYELPEHVISDPVNIIVESVDEPMDEPTIDSEDGHDSGREETEKFLLPKEEKGKGPARTPSIVTPAGFTVRIRRPDLQHDIIIDNCCETETVAILKERLAEEGETARLFYRGRELADTKKVKDYGYVPGDVLTALVV